MRALARRLGSRLTKRKKSIKQEDIDKWGVYQLIHCYKSCDGKEIKVSIQRVGYYHGKQKG